MIDAPTFGAVIIRYTILWTLMDSQHDSFRQLTQFVFDGQPFKPSITSDWNARLLIFHGCQFPQCDFWQRSTDFVNVSL